MTVFDPLQVGRITRGSAEELLAQFGGFEEGFFVDWFGRRCGGQYGVFA
jgi:hypothetical protein